MIKDFKIVSPGVFRVIGQTGRYTVDLNRGTCDCPAYSFGGGACKHLFDVQRIIAAGTRFGFAALDRKLQDPNEAVSHLASLAIRYRVAHLSEVTGKPSSFIRNTYVFW